MDNREEVAGLGKVAGNWTEIKPGCVWWYIAPNGQLVAVVTQNLHSPATAYTLEIAHGAFHLFAGGSDLTNRTFIRAEDAMDFFSGWIEEES